MYNAERKQLFIQYLTDYDIHYSINVVHFLEILEELEVQYDKDVCCFTQDEVRTIYEIDLLKNKTYATLVVYFYLLRKYGLWCLDMEFTTPDSGLITMPFATLKEIKGPADYITPEELTEAATTGFLNKIDRFVVRCIYEGFTVQQIAELTTDSLHIETKELVLADGTCLTISDDLVALTQEAIAEKYFRRGPTKTTPPMDFLLEENEFIVRFPITMSYNEQLLDPEFRHTKIKWRLYNYAKQQKFVIKTIELKDSGMIWSLLTESERIKVSLSLESRYKHPQIQRILNRYGRGHWKPYQVFRKLKEYDVV